MRKKGKFVSLLLLVLFGLNILAEAASNHTDSINTNQSSEAQMLTLHSTADCPDGDHPSDGTNNCADPCHTGRCHFGHCAYHVTSGYSAINPDIFNKGHLDFNTLAPKSPYLDGPKRPPRHS